MLASCLAGCAPLPSALKTVDRTQLRRDAMECLRAAIGYEHNPVVRVEAVEAMESAPPDEAGPWVRSALLDEQPAVRFAACMAVGRTRDRLANAAIRRCVDDPDANVRVAALFARHRLGHTEDTGRLTGYLLGDRDIGVRRNAAIAIGLLEEPSAIKALARAMRDPDPGVRHHALEGMARLGNRDARQELTFMANAGVGSEEVFALNALAATRDRTCFDTFQYKLTAATHLETRLAAARGLGMLGSGYGFDVALEGLTLERAARADPADPASGQLLRTRQLAAAALGAIGRPEALSPLEHMMRRSGDPRLQVSAARAILDILGADRKANLPFGDRTNGNR